MHYQTREILWYEIIYIYREPISEFGQRVQDGSEVEVCRGLQ